MRVTGGSAKGQQLIFPRKLNIRPTTDRTREAVFSILTPLAYSWTRGLDLFAGTGALGIEALSRDMEWIDFVDREPQGCAIIKQNLEKLGLDRNAGVHCCTVSKALTFLENKYDVIFMDPPYGSGLAMPALIALSAQGWLMAGAVAAVEHGAQDELASPNGFKAIDQRRYGAAVFSIFRWYANE